MWWLMPFPSNMKKKGPFFPFSSIILELQQDPQASPRYSWHNENLCYKGHMYLRKQSTLKSTVLSKFHASPTTENLGFSKTYEHVKHSFFLGQYET
jgi:hypothetical protein